MDRFGDPGATPGDGAVGLSQGNMDMAKGTKAVAVPAPDNTEEVVDQEEVQGTIEDLQELETTVEQGLDSFMAVGTALAEINDRRLYKLEGFSNFEEYCRQKWNIDKSFAYKQMKSAGSVKLLAEHFDTTKLPRNEAQARELSTIKSDEDKVETWTRALEVAEARGGALPTAAEVREVAKAVKSELGLEAEEAEPEEESPEKVYNRSLKAFPRVWHKFEEAADALGELQMRAISVAVVTDEDGAITESDIEDVCTNISVWFENFELDIKAYKDHRRAAQERAKAARQGRAKVAGGTHGVNPEAEAADAETDAEAELAEV